MNSEYNNPQFREFEDEGADIDIMAILGKLLKKMEIHIIGSFHLRLRRRNLCSQHEA